MVGKAYHIKICDFGRDCVEYRGDYSDQGDGILVPLRWMAWESVIQVSQKFLFVCFFIHKFKVSTFKKP